jgi:kexin
MVNDYNGTFIDWHLKLWGESINADKQALLPMPDEHDDDDHDKIISSTTTILGSTQAITPAPTPTSITAIPTDHPDRPVNAKPTGTDGEVATPTSSAAPEATTTASSWLPSFFPTFGVSSKTQIWIYGAAALILIFCVALGVYLWMARRKRLRNNPRDEWEFDLLEEDEAEGLNPGRRSAKVGKGGKRRAGELYDAFAAGSEDESDGEYIDGDEAVDEAEKKHYEEDDEEETEKHVIGDDEDEDDEDEKGSQRGNLLQK